MKTVMKTSLIPYVSSILTLLFAGPVEAGIAPDFESEVSPLLTKRCVECHQGDDPSGGLSLTTRDGLMKGGESGRIIEPGAAKESYLFQRIHDGEMPPEKQGKSQHLSKEEIGLIRRWIDNGAAWPEARVLDYFERTNDVRAGRDWWSLQPVVRPSVPRLANERQPNHPIDAFIRAKLEAADIAPAPRANRRTLIRRAYYDLIGLPPTEKEIGAFVQNDARNAWSNLIDRLLASPQYGERWGRFWLDLARYADTSGYERDQEKPFSWKYRDWVISAFNEDMPYEQFVLEQLAGDEIPNRTERSVIATGFLRLGAWNDEPNDPADYQYERLEELVHTTSSAFLALTVKCARCHSHKFDAITQEDYYRMGSAFWAGPIPLGSKSDLGGPHHDDLGFQEVLGWTDTKTKPKPLHVLKNGERLQPLGEVKPASLSTIPELEFRFAPPPKDAATSHRRLQLANWIIDPNHPLTARVFVNRLWQHHFGKALVRTPNNFGFLSDPPTHPDLLDWLAEEFLARGGQVKSMHRLILTSETWQQSSLHPDFEALYQRDSTNRLWWRAERRRLDAETLRDSLLAASGELDLVVGGEGFKPTISTEALEGLSRKSQAWQASPLDQQRRRSVYMYLKRGLLPPLMTTFDLGDSTQSCGKRDVTIAPTQALTLLNNPFVHERSMHLASTILGHDALNGQPITELEAHVGKVWSNVLGRQPSVDELRISSKHVRRQLEELSREKSDAVDVAGEKRLSSKVLALASLCHVLMNSNEFMHVD